MHPLAGFGQDWHRLEDGGGLWVGGVRVPCDKASVAHSDGDALLHAVTDALLGALGGPDIGDLFPDTAEENRGRPSRHFIEEAMRRVRAKDLVVGNVDTIVMLERPKLGSHKDAIRESLAQLLGCPAGRVAVKAKTAEAIGPMGAGEMVAAWAFLLLLPERAEMAA